MNVSLTRELERLVEQKVRSGMYQSASEVVREGLRLLQERDDLRQARLAELRKEIGIGVGQIRSGHYGVYDGRSLKRLLEKTKAEGRRKRAARKKKSSP